jgi:hypothetical protein
MKGFAIVFVLLCLVLAQASQAADLAAGSYVKFGGVGLWWTDPNTYMPSAVDWNPTISPDTYGPFQVTTDTAQYAPCPVTATVLTEQDGVPAGTGVTIYGQTDGQITQPVNRIDVALETNYDASQMQIEMYQHHASGFDELIWDQTRSGYQTGGLDVFQGTYKTLPVGDSIYFKIVAVPEPSQAMTLIIGLSALTAMIRRRQL